jgi:hypothetical protein
MTRTGLTSLELFICPTGQMAPYGTGQDLLLKVD